MGAQPDGEPSPSNGLLPHSASTLATDTFGVYVHIPFCRVRCGYCDFNTYTHDDMPGVSQADYASIAIKEIEFAGEALDASGIRRRVAQTVFFGGGTPTLLPAGHLVTIVEAIRDNWGLAEAAEVTVESNPDSVDEDYLRELVRAGVTRVSFGVQSFNPKVLLVLDRTHDPARVPGVVQAARDAGLQVSLDLIYGSPGETEDQWRQTLERAVALAPDHISAYSLIVEPGTALARRIARGELEPVNEDTHAQLYEIADETLESAGYQWYEVSNWARAEQFHSRHNLAYWEGGDWWGVGPGAHSHVGGVRWWNVKHPRAYAERIAAGVSPAQAREILNDDQRLMEAVMLRLRIRDGLPISLLGDSASAAIAMAIADGLVEGERAIRGTLVLTRKGRLLADGLARDLLPG